jgi:plastocyanin
MFKLTATTAILSLFATSLALPQYSYDIASAAAQVHKVVVGGSSLTYTPEAIAANPGDIVMFEFHQKNHTVTQSSFAGPCSHVDGGFKSGFMPVAVDATSFPVFNYTVVDTKPVWVYCGQTGHCAAGMVFAINCGADGAPNSFTNFKASAIATGNAQTQAPVAIADPEVPSVTIPAEVTASTVTQTVSLDGQTWTTTYASYPGSPDPTPSSLTGNTITVTVGANGQLAFDPPNVQAKPRDTVVFEFHQKNHTATQSSFDDPCRKLQFTSQTGQIGFDSGFMPVPANATTFPTFSVLVNDTAPIWVYCRQATPVDHCGSGMVFAINSVETSERNFAAFQGLAKQINGTAAASSTPGSTAPADSTGGSAKLAASISMSFVGVVAALLL